MQVVEYVTTPEHIEKKQIATTEPRILLSCWSASWKQRLKILFTGRVWLQVRGVQPPVSLHAGRDYGPPPPEVHFEDD